MLKRIFQLVIIIVGAINLGMMFPTLTLAQTGTCQNSIQHSGPTPTRTEHRMVVCGDGNIATGYGLFFKSITFDEGKDDGLGNITTMGIHFDQHGNNVDIGWQGDFQPVDPIRLNRPAYFGPYSEETYTRYKSRNLSYEIEQRTETVDSPWETNRTLGDTNNWVVMELLIRNTGSINLTGGKILYMTDFDPGTYSLGNKAYFDAATGAAYHTHKPNNGQPYSDRAFGMGIKLLSGGTLLGQGLGTTSSYPNSEATFLSQLNSPMYGSTQSIANTTKADYVSWLVIQIPDLAPGGEAKIAVGWCASVDRDESSLVTLIKNCLTTKPYLPALAVQKTTAMTGYVGLNTSTYTVSARYNVNPIVNSLVDSSVGNISVTGLGTYTATYTIPPTVTNPLVTTIAVKGSYNGASVSEISQTINQSLYIDFRPLLTLTVSSVPTTKADVTKEITYSIRVSHATTSDFSGVPGQSLTIMVGQIQATLISGDINGNSLLDKNEIWIYEAKYTPTLADPNPLVNTIALNGKDLNDEPIASAMTTHSVILAYNPKLQVVKNGPEIANANTIGTFSFRVSHAFDSDDSSVMVQTIVDNIAGQAVPLLTNGNNIGDGNKNGLLDKDEEWYYLVGYLFTISPPNPLVNQATVTWKDLEGNLGTAKSNFHVTTIVPGGSATTLEIRQDGPTTIRVGETMTYDIIIGHASNSGGAAVTIAAITDSLAFLNPITFTPSFGSGDEDNDGKLDANETFNFPVTFIVTNSTSNSFSHTMTVEGRDPENKTIFATTVPPIFTEIEYNSRLAITKTGPDTATVGQQVTYNFTVQHDPNSDNVAVFFGNINDNVTGKTVNCPQNGNKNDDVDEGETWQCISNSYTIKSTDPEQLTNIAIVNGRGLGDKLITATAQHTTRIEFAPQLNAIVSSLALQVQIGDKFPYTIKLEHKDIIDKSPITPSMVMDNLGNSGPCQAGSGNEDKKLDEGEAWYCVITATVPMTNLDPLTLTITAKGRDGNNDEISTTTQYSVDILFKPIVQFTLTGPTSATRGDNIQYQITLNHAPNSDGSEVCNLQLHSNLWSPPQSITNNGNNCLGQGETWQLSVPYTISQNAPFDLENIAWVSFTTGDNFEDGTNPSQVTTLLQGPQLEIIIQPNPINLTIGQKVSVTYQVTRLDSNADIIDSSLVLSSSLFGQAIRTVGSSPLLQGQTWTYAVAYTPLPDTPHEQTAEVVAISQNKIIGRSEVNVTVVHNPVLTLKVISKEGGFYTFSIDHASTSDKSPVYLFKVNGQDKSCIVLNPSTCTFTDTVALNAKFYEAVVEYTTLDSPEVISQTLRFDLIPQTYLPLIRKSPNENPAIILTKSGPATAKAGDTIKYTFTLKHDVDKSDGTAVCNITLSDPLIPNLSQTHTGDNGNTCLNMGETWLYEANYTVPANKTGSVDNTATVTGNSAETGKPLSANSNKWSTQIVVVNDCVAQTETFADSNSGWLVSSGPKVKWEYLNGQYVATSIDPNGLHFATSPKKSASADYLVSVEANWNSPIGDEYGLVFNVVGSGDTASMYLFNVNAQTGNYKLRRLVNGNYTTLSSGNSSAIKSGTTINKLQIQRTGNTFNLYVNDQLLGSASDSSLSASTKVGVNMLPSLSQKGQAVYDNFTICSSGGIEVIQPAEVNTINQDVTSGNINRP